MSNDVRLIVRDRGKLVTTRDGNNVFVSRGHQWLAELVTYATLGPDTYERNDRISYMQFGIGGNRQSAPTIADAAPLSAAYAAGNDPNVTGGHAYNKEWPLYPAISTLERPIRITGGFANYPGVPTDAWLLGHPSVYATHPTRYTTAIHGFVDTTAGDILYPPFSAMPLSEIGLLTDGVGVASNLAYSAVVAYYTFDTIVLLPSMQLEAIWTLKP